MDEQPKTDPHPQAVKVPNYLTPILQATIKAGRPLTEEEKAAIRADVDSKSQPVDQPGPPAPPVLARP